MSLTIIVMARHAGRFATLSHEAYTPLFGIEAADAILQALRIFSDPSNRIAIEQELSFLSSLRPNDPMAGAKRKKKACVWVDGC